MRNFIRPRHTKRFISGAIAGLFMALQLPLALLASPAVFADHLPQASHETSTNPNKVTICHRSNADTNPYVEITVSFDAATGELKDNGHSDHTSHTGLVFDANTTYPTPRSSDQWGDIIPAYTYAGDSTHEAGTYQGMNLTTAGLALLANHCNVPSAPVVTSTVAVPAIITPIDVCGVSNDTYTIPTTTGVTYKVNGSVVEAGTYVATGNVTVTAVAQTGYVFAVGALTSQTLTFTNVPCDTARVTLCHATGSPTNPFVEISVSAAGAYDGHYDHSGDIIPAFTYNGTNYASKGNQTLLASHCVPPVIPATVVTPATISSSDVCSTDKDTYTIPTTTGVTYKVNGTVVKAGIYVATGNVTVTAVAQTGYVFAVGALTSQTLTFTNVPCDTARVTLCHATGSPTNPFVEISVSAAGAYDGHYDHSGDIIPAFTYNGTNYAAHGNQDLLATRCYGRVIMLNIVTPAVISQKDECGTANDTYTIPTTTGINYQVNDKTVAAGIHYALGTVTIKAVAQEGYTLAVGSHVTQTLTFTNKPCKTETVTLCHATGILAEPYKVVSVSPSDAYNKHYIEHDDDIIPSFNYGEKDYSLNYDEAGQTILDNDCMVEHVGHGGGSVETPPTVVTNPVIPASTTVLSILTPPKTVTSSRVGNGVAELANTGNTALLNIFAGLFLIGAVGAITATSRRKLA